MADESRIAALQEILKDNPNDSFARYALGLEYSGAGETEAALLGVRQAPRSPSGLHQRILYVGASLAKAERVDEARGDAAERH